MFVRVRFLIAAILMLVAAPVAGVPQTDRGRETAFIPFDPPLGEQLRYRWQRSVQKDGETTLSWAVDDFSFAEADDDYRLTVTPISSGSNERDPRKVAFLKLVEELTRMPFVVRVSSEAAIVGLEREQEYWAKLITALRTALGDVAKSPDQVKVLNSLVSVFEKMPAETRLAHLTEAVQPLVEFGLTETTVGSPIITEVEGPSPFSGTVKREVAISLRKVDAGFAHLTIRSRIPGPEMERLTKQFIERLGGNLNNPANAAERDAGMAAIRQMKADTVADYKIALEDGMLESFQSTETVSVIDKGETKGRITTKSLTRMR